MALFSLILVLARCDAHHRDIGVFLPLATLLLAFLYHACGTIYLMLCGIQTFYRPNSDENTVISDSLRRGALVTCFNAQCINVSLAQLDELFI